MWFDNKAAKLKLIIKTFKKIKRTLLTYIMHLQWLLYLKFNQIKIASKKSANNTNCL